MQLETEHRAQNMVGFLAGELTKGWKAFLVAEQIQLSRVNSKGVIPEELSEIIQNSCLDTSIIALAKITDSHKDAIHINYLFDFAAANPSVFPLIPNGESLDRLIIGFRKKYAMFEPIFVKVRGQRDQLLAHLDKKLLRDPALHANNPISEDELRDGYAVLHTIIYDFVDYLREKDGIPTIDKLLNHKIANEFTILSGPKAS